MRIHPEIVPPSNHQLLLAAVHHGGLGKDVVDAIVVDPDIVLNQVSTDITTGMASS